VSGLVAAVVVLLVAGLAGVIWKWQDAEANLARALTAERNAADAADSARREAANARASQHFAEQQRRQAEESRYAADMHLAAQAVDEGDLGRAMSMLRNYLPSPNQADLRGFEWRSLAWRCWGQSRATYRACTDETWAVAFSPDSARLAVGGAEKTVSLLGVTTGYWAKIGEFPLPADAGGVLSLTFSPSGNSVLAATGAWNNVNAGSGAIYLWDADSKKRLDRLAGRNCSANCLALSLDEKYLAAGYEDNGVKIWRRDNGRYRQHGENVGHWTGVNAVSFSPDGLLLAIGWGDGHLRLVDPASLAQLWDSVIAVSGVTAMTFSRDGRALVVGTRDGKLLTFNIALTKSPLSVALDAPIAADTNQGAVESIAFSLDGNQFVTAGSNGTIKLWRAGNRQPLATLKGHQAEVGCVAMSADGKTLASASNDHTVKLWNLPPKSELPTFARDAVASSVAFSPDSTLLAVGLGESTSTTDHEQGQICLWRPGDSGPMAVLTGHTDVVYSVAFSTDGMLLASGSRDKSVIVWDVKQRRQFKLLAGHSDKV